MANRVLLGQRGSGMGMWVSRPGTNVLTTGGANMLMATDRPMVQVVQSGTFSNSGSWSRNVSIPNLGFQPVVMMGSNVGMVSVQFNSNTSLTFRGYRNATNWWYAVLNIPRN